MRELRLVLLGLAAIIALLLGASFLLRAFRSSAPLATAADVTQVASQREPPRSSLPPATLAAARGVIERAITEAPDYTRFFDRLRLVFPGDYETIMNALAEANQARGADGKEVNDDLVMADAVVALRRARGRARGESAGTGAGADLQSSARRDAGAAAARPASLRRVPLRREWRRLPVFRRRPPAARRRRGDRRARRDERRPHGAGRSRHTLRFRLPEPGQGARRQGPSADRRSTRCSTARPPIRRSPTTRCARPARPTSNTLGSLPADVRGRLYGLAVDLMAKS